MGLSHDISRAGVDISNTLVIEQNNQYIAIILNII